MTIVFGRTVAVIGRQPDMADVHFTALVVQLAQAFNKAGRP